ncbi:ArdC family protein [Rhabdaerophilum sp.]|uniref:ArdC family protein n=1 Tax=Rhabdaerophilum sp. TaxID=2717341 RepID=UPI0038D3B422
MNASPSRDVYTQVTDTIIAAIEAGAGQWDMPWHRHGVTHTRPMNALTGKRYRGVNVLALWAAAEARGFTTGLWGTYRQWQEKGAQVRKGEKSSLIVFFKELAVDETNPETGETERGRRLIAKASYVFNANQVDGFALPEAAAPANPAEVLAEVEAYVAATGARVAFGGEGAFCRPLTDTIHMPDRTRFVGSATSSATECLYATLLHELTHWTGIKTRCDREFGKRFGDDAYAMEELVAELGAAFLCADLGIANTPRPDHAAYISHWLTVLNADKKAIFTAASKAAQAVDYLDGLQPAEEAHGVDELEEAA